jgi:hypothetical protein
MYDTRPSKDNLELLRSGLDSEARETALSEAEKAAESIVLGLMARPGWSLRNDDDHLVIGDYAKRELLEEVGLDEKQWKEGLTVLMKDKVLVLDRSQDRKQHLSRNVVRVAFPPVDKELPSYLLTSRVLELALETLGADPDHNGPS